MLTHLDTHKSLAPGSFACALFLWLLSLVQGIAQAPCGADGLHTQRLVHDSAYQEAHAHMEQYIRQVRAGKLLVSGADFPLNPAPLVLPVVVHLVHQNGPENLTDAQVEVALSHLNAAFVHSGYFGQQGQGADVLIQFCLARQTPDGLATTGITRTASALTDMVLETQDLALKDLVRWAPTRYINIWLVRSVSSLSAGSSVAGYAYLPPAHGLPYDGLVVETEGLGKSPAQASNLVHEMGHYLGLYHTFEGGCINADCLNDGDRVCDTPPDRATQVACSFNSCSTDADDLSANNPFSADVEDAGWNFMDYSPPSCYAGFSAGQGVRMRTAAEGLRSSLLKAKSCLEPCPVPLTAAFALADSSVWAGEALVFTNVSSGATQFSWYDGNTLLSTQSVPPPYTPANTGIRTLRLAVGNGDARCADTAQVLVSVACNITASILASDTTLDIGQPVTLSAVGSGATQWRWVIGGQLVAEVQDFSYTPPGTGVLSVELTAFNPYCSLSVALPLMVGGACPQYFYRDYERSLPNAAGLSQLRPRTVESTRDGGYLVTGYVLGKGGALTKISPGGQQQWQRTLPGTTVFTSVEQDPDNNYLLTGFMDASQSVGFLVKCDPTGQVLWARQFKGVKSGRVLAVPCAAGGYYGLVQRVISAILTTWVAFRTDPDGNILWSVSRTSDNAVADMQAVADGGLMLGLGRAGLVKLTSSGQLVFAKRYGSGAQYFLKQERKAIQTDGNDTYLLSGWNNGYLWKTDANGEVVWAGYSENFLTMKAAPGQGLLVCKFGDITLLSPSTGQQLWTRGTGGVFSVGAQSEDLGVLQGARSGRGIYLYKEVGIWSALRLYEFSLAEGERASCVGELTKTISMQPIALQAEEDTLTLGNLPPNWEPMALTAVSDTNFFTLTLNCVEERCHEICDNGRDDDGNLYVDCYDPACPCAQPPLGCRDTVPFGDIQGRMAWMTPADQVSVVGVPLVGNLNPLTDSLPEIIVPSAPPTINGVGNRILIFRGDGSNAAKPDQVIVPGGMLDYPMAHPTLADLDGDGRVELIVMSAEGFVYIFTDYQPGATGNCMKMMAKSNIASNQIGLRIYPADFDHDGLSELYSGGIIYWLTPGSAVLQSNIGTQSFVGALGIFALHNQVLPANSSLAADLLNDPGECGNNCPTMEVVAGGNVFSIRREGNEFEALLQNYSCPTLSNGIGYATLAQVDPFFPVLTQILMSSATGTIQVCQPTNIELSTDSDFSISLLCIANVFDDRKAGLAFDMPEILVGKGGFLYCLNTYAPSNMWWKIPTALWKFTGRAVTAFDFNGDGFEEIVLHDSTHLRVLYGGPTPFPPGVDADRNWFTIAAPSLPLDNYPVIADVDGDLEAEILYTAYADPARVKTPDDRRGRLVVLKSQGEAWYPARPVWNQFSYLPIAINDDLTVPRQQQVHHLRVPANSNNRPFNRHQAQLPLFDSLYRPYRPLFDVALRTDSIRCFASGDSVQVWLTVCNYGEKALPDSLPLALYTADPTATAAPLLRSLFLKGKMRKGDCRTFSIRLPNLYAQPLFLVANDDGTTARPYALTGIFPARRGRECGYADNFVSFKAYFVTQPLDFGPDIKQCGSTTRILSAGSGYASYRWHDGSTDSTYTAYTAGKYWVEVRDFCGKTYSDTLVIQADSLVGLTLPTDTLLCTGDSVRLSVTGALLEQISWSPAVGLSCSHCFSPVAQPSVTTSYVYTLVRGECFVTDSVRVEVRPFSLQLEGQNPTCNIPGSITPLITGTGPFDFKWSNGSTTPVLQGLESGTYALTLTNSAQCVRADTLTLVRMAPSGVAASADSVRCYGASDGRIVIGPVAGGLHPLSYSLDGQVFQSDSVFEQLPARVYSVVVRDANGCTISLPGGLSVAEAPVFEVSLSGSTLVIPGLPFMVKATVSPVAAALKQIRWQPAALFPQPDQLEQTLTLQTSASVWVQVTNADDCTAADSLLVELDKTRLVYFPNAFYPDGPALVENTRFTAYGSEGVARVLWLRIFDRWGSLLFEQKDFAPGDSAKGWDGRHNGRLLPSGVYVWVAEVAFTDGERQSFQGEVSLLR